MNAQPSKSGRGWPHRNSHVPRPFRLRQVDAAERDGRDDPPRPLAEREEMSEPALHEPPLGASRNPGELSHPHQDGGLPASAEGGP